MAQAGVASSSAPVTLTVVIVSYNTRIMTLKALETLYQHTHATRFDCVVLDNASSDGSADAIASAFPQVQLIRAPQNLGFAHGGWARDTVRQVDIVVGCFLLIEASLWRRLGGFSPKYFMYGEDADLCLRARAFGYHPMITPNAQIVHHVGASTSRTEAKAIAVMTSRASLIRDHWPKSHRGAGIFLMWLWSATRYLATRPLIASNRADRRARAAHWAAVWTARKLWLQGYD